MQNTVAVAEVDALQQMVHEHARNVRRERAAVAVRVHVLLKILLAELEDKHELCLGVDHIVQTDDVFVVKLLHERDLADRGRRSALLRIKVNLLQRNNLIGGSGATLGAVGNSVCWTISRAGCVVTPHLVDRCVRSLAWKND